MLTSSIATGVQGSSSHSFPLVGVALSYFMGGSEEKDKMISRELEGLMVESAHESVLRSNAYNSQKPLQIAYFIWLGESDLRPQEGDSESDLALLLPSTSGPMRTCK